MNASGANVNLPTENKVSYSHGLIGQIYHYCHHGRWFGLSESRYASLFPPYYIIIVCLYLSLSFLFPFLNPQQQKSHLTGRNSLDLFLILHYFFNFFQYFFQIFNILCFILLKILTFRRPCISNKNSTTLLYLKRNLTRSIPFFLLDL